ncbi:hypothetical protein D3C71_1349350 [compost metagenome]
MASDSCWLMPAIGSSSNSRDGWQASTIASSSCRSSPCASSPASVSARADRPTSAKASCAGSVSAAVDNTGRQKRKLWPRRACTAITTFSSAVNGLKTEVIW